MRNSPQTLPLASPAAASDGHVAQQRARVLPVEVGRASIPIELAKSVWLRIMASGPHGMLYVGMTSDVPGRALEHREGLLEGVTTRYGVDRLVYFEAHSEAADAVRRERAMKHWRRNWKIELVEKTNPTWRDLFADVLRDHGFED